MVTPAAMEHRVAVAVRASTAAATDRTGIFLAVAAELRPAVTQATVWGTRVAGPVAVSSASDVPTVIAVRHAVIPAMAWVTRAMVWDTRATELAADAILVAIAIAFE